VNEARLPGHATSSHTRAYAKRHGERLAGGNHCLSPAYLLHQLDLNRSAIGVETLDAFLIDQPEVHIPVIGKAAFMDKLLGAFTALEGAVRDGRGYAATGSPPSIASARTRRSHCISRSRPCSAWRRRRRERPSAAGMPGITSA
jgi:aryl-alcohol dehydrogenase-like predicted oxidoreductase